MKVWIKKAFENTKNFDSPCVTHTILYYSGTAKENGDWLCQDGSSVSIEDVFNQALAVDDFNGNIEIYSDSDYSGQLS